MKYIGKFKDLLDGLTELQITQIIAKIKDKQGEDEDVRDFFDEVEDMVAEPTDQNIYVVCDKRALAENLMENLNVYAGGEYEVDIDGPMEYTSIGFSIKQFLGAKIHIDQTKFSLFTHVEDALACIVWEITRYGITEEEREEVRKILHEDII